VPKSAQPWVATLVRTIFDQPDADAFRAHFARVVETIEQKFPAAAEHLDQARADLLAFTAFPREIWRQIWSNNPQERLNQEIRRRTHVVGIFPNRAAIIRLVGAVLAEQTDEWTEARRYMASNYWPRPDSPPSTPNPPTYPQQPTPHRRRLPHKINLDLHGDRLLHHARGRDQPPPNPARFSACVLPRTGPTPAADRAGPHHGNGSRPGAVPLLVGRGDQASSVAYPRWHASSGHACRGRRRDA
jgi:hypothetical protein